MENPLGLYGILLFPFGHRSLDTIGLTKTAAARPVQRIWRRVLVESTTDSTSSEALDARTTPLTFRAATLLCRRDEVPQVIEMVDDVARNAMFC